MLIISPHFPPTRGGVADHTASLARELAARHAVKVLTSPGVYRSNGVEAYVRYQSPALDISLTGYRTQFANYIAPPARGVNRTPINFEYVRTEM